MPLSSFFKSKLISQTINISYKNVIILSDLSSRMQNQTNKDFSGIDIILNDFRNNSVKPGVKIGDRSSVFFSTFNDGIKASIDLDDDMSLGDKQAFINSKGKFISSGFDFKLVEFKKIVKKYIKRKNLGLDLISILNEKIKKEFLIKSRKIVIGNPKTIRNFYNHIYIFTDGYLEFQSKNADTKFYFGSQQIAKVRSYCVRNNVDIIKALKINNSLCLPPIKNDKNKLISLHVWETHERDKNVIAQTYKYPIGLRDNEILECVWRKWAFESGFANFEWKSIKF